MSTTFLRRLFSYQLFLQALWAFVVVSAILYHYLDQNKQAHHYAALVAQESLNKDLLYRRWNAGLKGVYVPISEQTPANPYLDQIPDRDLATVDGLQLTKVNPAYMTRQVHELGRQQYNSKGHITSLKSLRPENAPDAWEAGALHQMETVRTPVIAIVEETEGRFLRMMIPLETESSCLPCHQAQGHRLGDLRGGLSTSIPLAPFLAAASQQQSRNTIVLVLLWGIGAATLGFGHRRLERFAGEQEAAHQRLAASEQRFSNYVNSTDGIVWELELSSMCFTFVSQQAERLLGYPLDEWQKPGFWSEHLHPEDRAWAIAFCLSETERLADHAFEYRFMAKDGRIVWLRDLVNVVVVDGKAIRLTGIMFDISESKRNIVALEEYRQALDVSEDMICVVDADRHYTLANDAFLRMRNTARERVVGRHVRVVLGDNAYALVEEKLDRCFAGAPQRFEMTVPGLQVEERPLLVSCTPIQSEGKADIDRVVAVISDVSMIKQVEKELRVSLKRAEDAGRAKNEFLANMSHELRTPLNGVLGMMQLLEVSHLDAQQKEMVALARQSGNGLLELLQDILDLSSIEAGRLPLAYDTFAPSELVRGITANLQPGAAAKGIALVMVVDASVPVNLYGCPSRLRQILLNLVGNALKFTEHGNVSCQMVIVGGDGPQLKLRTVVSDTGIGIDEENLQKIFEPFTQVEGSYRRRFQGAGLGLSIVKRLVEMLDGEITVASRVGEGTTVTVTIPVAIGT